MKRSGKVLADQTTKIKDSDIFSIRSDNLPTWCPGCGYFGIHHGLNSAIQRMKQGSYGTCELCQCKIPVGRLNALPYSTMCIRCQSEVETSGNWEFNTATGSWENVSESDPFDDRNRVNLSDIEFDYSK